MNYRHHFHAGNFADVVKHAVLSRLLDQLSADPTPVTVVDTHAGASRYDLGGAEALRSGEALTGIGRLMADPSAPPAFDELKAAVRNANSGQDRPFFYPGSPLVALAGLRAGDRYVGCELRSDDHDALSASLSAATRRRGPSAKALLADGFEAGPRLVGAQRALMLVDPPYERGDDESRIAACLGEARTNRPDVTALVWAPLKDLTGFDALLASLEGLGFPGGLSMQVRLRTLATPLKLNGCALIALGSPALMDKLLGDAEAICSWAVERLGEPGGRSVVELLG